MVPPQETWKMLELITTTSLQDHRLALFGAVPALRSAPLSWLPSASVVKVGATAPTVEVRAERTGMRLLRAAAEETRSETELLGCSVIVSATMGFRTGASGAVDRVSTKWQDDEVAGEKR